MEFPRWEYHVEHGGRLFKTPEELQEAGEGWFDSPALVPPKEEDDATGSSKEPEPMEEVPKSPSIQVKRGPGRPRKVAE